MLGFLSNFHSDAGEVKDPVDKYLQQGYNLLSDHGSFKEHGNLSFNIIEITWYQ